jgi:hypothetical protein
MTNAGQVLTVAYDSFPEVSAAVPSVIEALRPQIEIALGREKDSETRGQLERALGLD